MAFPTSVFRKKTVRSEPVIAMRRIKMRSLLATLWELYPDHEFLLPAYLDGPRGMMRYMPRFSTVIWSW